ncbi:MAG: hypothetical protein RBS22_04855 [Spongiibacteraceae bacterium]|nr:hypothetical protein [Spongiibacteraceae bacterium]
MPDKTTARDTRNTIPVELLAPTPVSVSIMIEDGHVVFRTEDGEALYTYDLDPPGESTCQGACAAQWAPLIAETGSRTIGDWTTIQKPDGTFIWAYRNRAVYVARKKFEAEGNNGPWRPLTP